MAAFALPCPGLAQALELKLAPGLEVAGAASNAGPPTPTAPPLALRLARDLPANAAAGPAPQRAAPSPLQELIVSLSVNGVPLGDSTAYMTASNEFLIPLAAFAKVARLPPGAPRTVVEGETVVFANEVPGAHVAFDEAALELRVVFPPEYFPRQEFRYQTGKRADVAQSRDASALLTYTVGGTSMSGGGSQWNVSAEADLFWRGWLLRNQFMHFDAGDGAISLRGLTQLVKDDPRRLTRFIAGDFFVTPTELTGGVILAGLSYSRSFDLDPYLVRQPTAAFSGVAELPSDVSFFVGNTRVYQQRVAPGAFDIGNVSYITGQREVRIVMRDIAGRERTVFYPFYFSDQGLAPGLQDFSYQAGAIREDAAVASADFGAMAFSATHRIGLSDAMTAGFHAEGTREFVNGGPGLVLRSDKLGVVSVAYLASRARGDDAVGHAGSLQYQYQSGRFAGTIGTHRASRAFAFLHAGGVSGLPLRDDFVSLSYGDPAFGTLSLSHRYLTVVGDGPQRDTALSYAISFGPQWSVRATYRRTTGLGSGSEFDLGVQYVPRPDFAATASLRENRGGSRVASLDFGNIIGEGEGLGYHVALEHGWSGAALQAASPSIDYRMRYGELQLAATTSNTPAGRSSVLSGLWGSSIAYVAGNLGMSRRMDDSFGVVQIDPPLPGVRVRLNSQISGRTDAAGRLFLPRLVSYVENYVAIEDKDIPISYGVAVETQVIVPQPHAGYVIAFPVRKLMAASGSLRYRIAGRDLPLASVLFTIDVAGKRMELPTASNGQFYFENVPPGDYPAEVEIEGRPCRFTLSIPAAEEAVTDLRDVQTCDIP